MIGSSPFGKTIVTAIQLPCFWICLFANVILIESASGQSRLRPLPSPRVAADVEEPGAAPSRGARPPSAPKMAAGRGIRRQTFQAAAMAQGEPELIPGNGGALPDEGPDLAGPAMQTYEPMPVHEGWDYDGGMAGCGCEGPCDGSCGCEPICGTEMAGCDGGPVGYGYDRYSGCAPGGCGQPCPPLIFIDWCRFDVFAGTHAFSGPSNFRGLGIDPAANDGTGSFGFHEGFNYGRNLPWLFSGQMSGQMGLRATQSNLAGSEFTDSHRNQLFLTMGAFRRIDFGLQGGVVFDYLHDDWDGQFDLTQVRGELSWIKQGPEEWGYRFTLATNRSSDDFTINDHINAIAMVGLAARGIDQHRFFYRHHFGPVSTAEVSAGWTDDSEAILGGQVDVPLSPRWGLSTGFTMQFADGPNEPLNQQHESWNVYFSLVCRPVGNRTRRDYHLPLFPVADNGTFLYRVTQ